MNRFFVPALLLSSACATTSSNTAATPPAAASSAAEPQKLAITNVIPFDIASCAPRALTLAPLTAEVITGAMLSMSPATQECFVDARNREGQSFDLKAKLTVAETGVTVELSGAGASAAGKACVEAAFKKLAFAPLAAGSKAVSAEIPLGVGAQTVHLGDNVANDLAGHLRLAQPQLCECYAKLGQQTPPNLKADVEIAAESAVKASFPTTDDVTTCLTGKVQAMKLGDAQVRITWPLLLKNSYGGELDPAAPAPLRFQQLDGMRAQRTSDVLIAAGQRVVAALAFDDLAQKYKKKPAKGMLEELKTKCDAVVAGDDKQLAAVKNLVAVLESSQKLVQVEKAKDAQWAQVEGQLAQQLTSSTAEATRVEEQKKNDLNACPKTKF